MRENLIPEALRAQLLEQGARGRQEHADDFKPLVRLFVPDSNACWLLAELDPDDPDLAYGLCDPGLGTPRLDYVRLSDLIRLAGDSIELDEEFASGQLSRLYLGEDLCGG